MILGMRLRQDQLEIHAAQHADRKGGTYAALIGMKEGRCGFQWSIEFNLELFYRGWSPIVQAGSHMQEVSFQATRSTTREWGPWVGRGKHDQLQACAPE